MFANWFANNFPRYFISQRFISWGLFNGNLWWCYSWKPVESLDKPSCSLLVLYSIHRIFYPLDILEKLCELHPGKLLNSIEGLCMQCCTELLFSISSLKFVLHLWPWTTKPVKSYKYICSNSQKYIVWLKIIDFSFIPKVIRILSKDHVPWRYFVHFFI